ncbi:hypothetical protein M0K88_004951, partial [Escherichia coli]
ADRQAVSHYLNNIVPASDIGPRPEGSVNFRLDGKIPTDGNKLRAWLKKNIEHQVSNVERDRLIYENYRRNGADQVSDSDLLYSSTGRTATEAVISALETCFYLKSNHISYGLSLIADMRRALDELEAQPARSPKSARHTPAKGAIPPGYEFVDVWLPARQAFIVKKWAEVAKRKIQADGKR